VQILNVVFEEMSLAPARGMPVEFLWAGLKQLLGRQEAAGAAWEFMSDPAFRKAYRAEMHPPRRGRTLVNK
jgi:hypothetical protein